MSKTLYISNLATSMDSSTLEDMFTTVGDVESVSLTTDPTGRATAVVEMRDERQAADCIDRFNGHNKDGRVMNVTDTTPEARAEMTRAYQLAQSLKKPSRSRVKGYK